MTLAERRRLFMLALLLTATLAVAAVSGLEQDGRAPSGSGKEAKGPSEKVGQVALSRILREPIETAEVDIFAARSWQPAPPPPAQSTAPVDTRPRIPSLPFVYAGQLGDPQTGKVIVYLTRGDAVYTASVGDMLDDQYRLEAISDRQITFVYLPTKEQQTLAIPGN
jgi:hypothetical protein